MRPEFPVTSLLRRGIGRGAASAIAAGMLVLAGGLAQAQQAATPNADGGGLDGVLRALDLKPQATHAPDFVTKTRPDDAKLHYIPVGTPHPDRSVRTMTPAEVAAAEADLDSARMAQQRRAGLKPVAVPDKPKKPAPKTAPTTVR